MVAKSTYHLSLCMKFYWTQPYLFIYILSVTVLQLQWQTNNCSRDPAVCKTKNVHYLFLFKLVNSYSLDSQWRRCINSSRSLESLVHPVRNINLPHWWNVVSRESYHAYILTRENPYCCRKIVFIVTIVMTFVVVLFRYEWPWVAQSKAVVMTVMEVVKFRSCPGDRTDGNSCWLNVRGVGRTRSWRWIQGLDLISSVDGGSQKEGSK